MNTGEARSGTCLIMNSGHSPFHRCHGRGGLLAMHDVWSIGGKFFDVVIAPHASMFSVESV